MSLLLFTIVSQIVLLDARWIQLTFHIPERDRNPVLAHSVVCGFNACDSESPEYTDPDVVQSPLLKGVRDPVYLRADSRYVLQVQGAPLCSRHAVLTKPVRVTLLKKISQQTPSLKTILCSQEKLPLMEKITLRKGVGGTYARKKLLGTPQFAPVVTITMQAV
ncbi:hypothetical protein BDW59DRAFT_167957 [Aspergillus cavernicola]|uniref:Uncharacterized protein n=1 Tax=Aspergillus cavernicola TaxID=176166 RepID=A0ABR4H8H4_9EURO